ncbi:MAG TPA: hypothetical protein VFT78_03635 [Hanamia sp.]|nr:hypothetical protein [Hanamia sp.]
MKKLILKISFIATVLIIFSAKEIRAQYIPAEKIFQHSYNLIPAHSLDTQYYSMESRLTKISPDGTTAGTDVYRLYLRCVPPDSAAGKGDEYTCLNFTIQQNDSAEKTIPALTNWHYHVQLKHDTKTANQPLFGIDQSKFEHLVDETGKEVPVEIQFHIYNAFVDFYSMSVFSEKTDSGKGIQDLKHVGDKIIHSASYSQPAEDLGSRIAKGSYFKNGEITLEFKGLGNVNHKVCAILGYDSGASSFVMIMKPMPNMEVKTHGSSHGDIYKDLKGGWIQKASLHEFVVSQTQVPGMTNKINGVVERTITIKNVSKIQ